MKRSADDRTIREIFSQFSESKKQKFSYDDLTEEQLEIFESFKNGQNIYISGEAGTGKSTLLNKLIKYSKHQCKQIIVTASTGYAAQHINGITIHSAILHTDFKDMDIIFIDEINMLGPHFIWHISNKLARLRGKARPFGGIQVVVSGDVGQLEPIEDCPFTSSPLFNEFNFKKFELKNHYRQTDNNFIELLRRLRNKSLTEKDHLLLESRIFDSNYLNNIDAIRVFTKKMDVENYNNLKLASLKTRIIDFKMTKPSISNNKKLSNYINLYASSLPVPELVRLAVGAPVIVVVNINSEIVNGMRGVIKDIKNKTVIVEFNNGKTHKITRFSWKVKMHGKTKYNIEQIPLILGWAISSHKCQCATFDKIVVSIDENIFAKNQVYTLLSRVKNLDDLYIEKYNKMYIK